MPGTQLPFWELEKLNYDLNSKHKAALKGTMDTNFCCFYFGIIPSGAQVAYEDAKTLASYIQNTPKRASISIK